MCAAVKHLEGYYRRTLSHYRALVSCKRLRGIGGTLPLVLQRDCAIRTSSSPLRPALLPSALVGSRCAI
eukprot:2231869-Rhodomonas_salina.3